LESRIMSEKTINDIPISILLETIERLQIEAEGWVNRDFDDLLQDQPIFIRKPILDVMAQPGYPDNIDWDALVEDGGLSLIQGT